MFIKIHRLLGITLVFFVMVLLITGALLQHAEDINIRQKYASSSIAKNFYNLKPCQISSIKIENKWISLCNSNLYLDTKKILSNVDNITAAYKNKSVYYIYYDDHMVTVSENYEIQSIGHKADDVRYKIELKDNIINKGLKRIIEDKSISSTITYERIIVDLHTGRLFGVVGITLIDIVTLGMLVLSITGTISWMRHKKIF